jgi:ABC-type nitrate/sulfonate/bicarbonate transport system permease component
MRGRWRGFVIPVLAFALWELGSRAGILPHDTMSRPSDIAVAGWEALGDGSLLTATFQTFENALLGLAIGTTIGILISLPLGLSPVVEAIVSPSLETLRPIPSVALIPLALLLFGFGLRMEVLVVSFACVWPVMVVSVSAIRGIDPRLIEVGRMIEMPVALRMLRIVLPAALARIGVGIRVAAGVALVVAVTVEIVLNPQGLGYGMMAASQSLHPELMWAELLWVGAVGWGFNALLVGAERRWLGRFMVAGVA